MADTMPNDSFRVVREGEEAVEDSLEGINRRKPAPHGMVDLDLISTLHEKDVV